MFQDRLLYFPAKAAVADMVSGGLRAWPATQDFRGLVADPVGSARGTVIVFHGNAGHAGHREYYATALARTGTPEELTWKPFTLYGTTIQR